MHMNSKHRNTIYMHKRKEKSCQLVKHAKLIHYDLPQTWRQTERETDRQRQRMHRQTDSQTETENAQPLCVCVCVCVCVCMCVCVCVCVFPVSGFQAEGGLNFCVRSAPLRVDQPNNRTAINCAVRASNAHFHKRACYSSRTKSDLVRERLYIIWFLPCLASSMISQSQKRKFRNISRRKPSHIDAYHYCHRARISLHQIFRNRFWKGSRRSAQ